MRPFLTCGLAVGVAIIGTACASRRSREPAVQVAPGRNDPQVGVEIYPGRMVFDVESPRGVGSTAIELAKKFRPRRLTVRLHLSGLEEVRVSYAGKTITASLASAGCHGVRQWLVVDGAERAVCYGDRHWMRIRVEGDTPVVIPLVERWIEVDVPPDLLKSSARTFTVEWVDFFR